MTDNTDPHFTLITLSYNSGPHTGRCLAALSALEGRPEIVHADNGSTDIDLKALAAQFPHIRTVHNRDNLGFAVAMNRAARLATTPWIGFVNPDAFVQPNWLSAMADAIGRYPDVAMFTSLQVDADDPLRLDGAGDAMTFFGFPYRMGFNRPRPLTLPEGEVFAPCGAAMLIRRDLFERLGGFDERFFCYCEDADLGFRARLAGEVCLFVPRAVVAHVGSASTSVRSDFALWHGYRNRVWLYLKNMPLLLLLLTLPVHVALTLLGAIKDTFKGKGHVVWPALTAALTGIATILRVRSQIQKTRRISTLRLVKSLTWNPVNIASRAINIRNST